MRVLMLAPSKNIADQLYGQDGQTGLGRFTYLTHGKNIRRHYGSARANSKVPVVVSTYAGLNVEAKKGQDGMLGNFDLIIGDECHWSLGAETS